ncbi:MAG: DEAD/DEAH box helicase, partial [Myxococcota bacterium]|nr:DEAD/DEAH box helicase [Myxococcota bacterium]
MRPATFSPPAEALASFHPVLREWFAQTLGEPTEPQVRGWPEISAGRDVLVAAPTGSGKTLAAFFSALDVLFRQALAGTLTDQTQVVYVSPLKALSNDVQKNLIAPLEAIYALARGQGLTPPPIRVQVRTGDTPAHERAAMIKRPPHILITTPESLYLYLTSERSRQTLRPVRTLIVDEIHAVARDKRGSHLALSLERLKALCDSRPQIVGLSATVKPLQQIADFLVGIPAPGVQVEPPVKVQVGHQRAWDLRVETPDGALSAVASHEMWGTIYDRLVELAGQYRTLLVFANTRRMSERMAHDLGERLGKDQVAAHHGSMSRELRLSAEQRLKAGTLRVMVATASLELGIDIGSVDLVAQIGSPRAISAFLQRVGRAEHHKAGISRGIFFAMTRDDLVEGAALLRAVQEGDLDAVVMPQKPLDILAQQIVAACSAEEWDEKALFQLVRRAYPFRDLAYAEYQQVVTMLAEGITTNRGRSRVLLHHDQVNGRLKARRGSRITAVTNGGAIPDTFTYPVIAEPEGKTVGSLDEDFAVESMAGDVFVLGSTSWRIQSVRGGAVRVENANGQAPTVPFWLGEAPSRTPELSSQVARLREDLSGPQAPELVEKLQLRPRESEQLLQYLSVSKLVLGAMPSQTDVVAERFFDEAGGMQLIIHAPFGGRINRAWGMALRKCFCRTFDFELQAAATDDGLLLSLGEQHSFPLMEIFDFVHPERAEEVLVQAILQAPLFGTRFRWNANRSLALPRFSMGKRVPPQIQRARSEDLLAAVFPGQVGCQDNHAGAEIEVPDHPLVKETMDNCLREAMDVDGLVEVLRALKSGKIRKHAVDLPEPSPLAHALLNSAPYTYLDDAPLEERRARAVSVRRTLSPEDAAAFGALDAAAIAQVIEDAQPLCRDADELHDTLLQLVVYPEDRTPPLLVEELLADGRITRVSPGGFLAAAERVQHVQALAPQATQSPPLTPLPGVKPVDHDQAVLATVRGWMELIGPTTVAELSALLLLLPRSDLEQALFKLESEGQALRGTFRPRAPHLPAGDGEWCDRRLLQRIHRLTVGRLRKEVEPLTAQDFMRFLFRWHHLDEPLRGSGGLLKALALLQGYEAPAAAWEQFLLPVRMKQYLPELLERACWSGEVA